MMDFVPEEAFGLSTEEVMAPISEGEQQELVKKLKHEYTEFQNVIAPLHKNLDRWHKLYEAKRQERKTFPWEGASDYTVPLSMAIVDSVHGRIMKAVFEVDPLWVAAPRTPAAHDTAKKAEWYLDMWADNMRLAHVLDSVAMNMLQDGVGILKTDWVREVRRIPSQDGSQQEVVEYEGPRGYAVPLKDFVLIPPDSPTIDDAVYVGHRVFLNQQKLQARQKAGVYFNVSKLLEKAGDDKTGGEVHPSGVLATSGSGSSAYPETRQFEVVEMYGSYEFDPSVGPEPALFTFSPQHDILLRLEPYAYQYARAPYTDFCIFPRSNFFWGRSLVEMLESAQEELTALHNMRADSIVRQVAPPILRRQGAVWNPEDDPWKPGQVIDVTDPAEIVEMNLSPVPNSIFAHAQDILANTERMTGMSDLFMGRISSPYQTATATTTARSEGLVRIDVSITRFQESMRRLAWILWWLLYQYRPFLEVFQAENTTYQLLKPEMAPGQNGVMPFDFTPQGMQSDASKEARRQQLIYLLNTSAGVLQQYYPDGIQKLLEELFDAFDIKNKADILGPQWSILQQQIQQAMQMGYQQGQQELMQQLQAQQAQVNG